MRGTMTGKGNTDPILYDDQKTRKRCEQDIESTKRRATGLRRRLEKLPLRQACHRRRHHRLERIRRRFWLSWCQCCNPASLGAGGVVAQALGAIENALLDAKAKLLGVPCYELLGGKIRDRIRVYWSHCATWRINHPSWYTPAIESLDGVKAIGREVREKKFTALKTNIFTYEGGKPTGWRPGF